MKSGRHYAFAIATVALLSCGIAPAAERDNAADLYRDALQAVPIAPEDLATLQDPKPSPEASRTLLAKGAKSLKLMHDAAAISKCDWDIDISGKSNIDLAFLSPARPLWGLAELQVNSRMAEGKREEAAAILSDVLVMGRRVQGIGLVVPRLVGFALENGAIDLTAEHLPQFDAKSVRRLSETFEKLPLPPSLDDELAADKRTTGQDVNPESIPPLKAGAQRTDVIRAMFVAVLKAPQGGAESFRSTKDPIDGKPFGYRALSHGYQLSSTLLYKGEPVTLDVGKSEEK
jgi:hypothetical protein